MEKAAIIEELRKRFGEKLFLDSADVAKALGTTPGAFASLKHRGGFNCPMSRVGGKLAVSVFDFADFVAGGYKSTAQTSTAAAIKDPARKSERYQALGFCIKEQVDFLQATFAAIESESIEAAIEEAKESDGGELGLSDEMGICRKDNI